MTKIKNWIKKKVDLKKKLIFISIFIFIIIIMNTSKIVIASEYENYLFNDDLVINHDESNLIYELASDNNDYRNYIESGIEIEHSGGQIIETDIDSTGTNYAFSQTSFDYLNETETFKSLNVQVQDIFYNHTELEVKKGSLITDNTTEIYDDNFGIKCLSYQNNTMTYTRISSYSFTNDVLGTHPDYFQSGKPPDLEETTVIASYDGQTKVAKLDDSYSCYGLRLYKYPMDFETEFGQISFLFQVDSVRDNANAGYQLLNYGSSSTSMLLWFKNTHDIYYYNEISNSYQDSGANYIDDFWYNITLDFDFGSNSYLDLNDNSYRLTINDVVIDDYPLDDIVDDYYSQFRVYSTTANIGISYVDDISFSWFNNQTVGSEYEYDNVLIQFKSKEIDFYPDSYLDDLFMYSITFQLGANISVDMKIDIFDFNLDLWITKYEKTDNDDLFGVNNWTNVENLLGLDNKMLFRINYTSESENDFESILDWFIVQITYRDNEQGYYILKFEVFKTLSDGTFKSKIDVNLVISKRIISIEIREYLWIGYWGSEFNYQFFNISDMIYDYTNRETFVLETLEFEFHVRDSDSGVNFLMEIIMNYNETLYFTETIDNLSDLGTYFDIRMDYSRHNNYGTRFTVLNGIRQLKGKTGIKYNRFFNIPYFNEPLSLIPEPIPDNKPTPDNKPNEPTSDYWYYDTYELENHENTTIFYEQNVEYFNDTTNVIVETEYMLIQGKKITEKYFYEKEIVKGKDLGSWKFKIVIITVDFNAVRNALVFMINIILLIGQFFLYLLTIAFNFIIMYLGLCVIVPFLWNFVWYWIYSGILFVLFEIWSLLIWLLGHLWNFGIWLIQWLIYEALPVMVIWIIMVIAFIIALFIWLMTLGNSDLDSIVIQTERVLNQIALFLFESIVYFIENIEFFMIYILIYVLFFSLGFVKLWYTKMKGFSIRSERLRISLQAIIYPFILLWKIMIKFKDMVNPYS